jgi:riboflavin synthase
MFTGIIHQTALVLSSAETARGRRVAIVPVASDHVLGESIAVNGCCLTVAEISAGALMFDVIPESLEKTNLGELRAGDVVHIERSLRAGDPIDGHFVQGHVDGTGKLVRQITDEKEWRLRIEAPVGLARYLVPKGSIAIDGVSLTLALIEGNVFEVALIPTTLELTELGKRQVNYRFNLECDSMVKTIISYLERIHPVADDGVGT